MDLPDVIEIPSGLVQPRTIAGLPLEGVILLAAAVGLPWIAFHSLWTLLVALPAWAFLKYHSQRDPLFIRLWAGQFWFKSYYHG